MPPSRQSASLRRSILMHAKSRSIFQARFPLILKNSPTIRRRFLTCCPRRKISPAACPNYASSDQMDIIVYEQELFSAPHAWWILRTLVRERLPSQQRFAHVDRGWPAHGMPQRPSTPASVCRQVKVRRGEETYRVEQNDRAASADSRCALRWPILRRGAEDQRPGLRSGHMPGATNVPYTELVQDGRLNGPINSAKSSPARGSRHRAAGYNDLRLWRDPRRSSRWALRCVGAQQVSVYDGSWAEYAQRPRAVIEMA